MQGHTLEGHAKPVTIDLCLPCQTFWFDGLESIALTPASTLALFRIIGEHPTRPHLLASTMAKCPRCRTHLRRIRDLQRATRFEYLKCPNDHGRLITFFEFLKEKDFIRPLTPQQIAELRRNVQTINCSNCGAPIDLAKNSACAHCRSPLSMLDMNQAEKLVEQLRNADRPGRPIYPARPMVRSVPETSIWFTEVSAAGLVGAGLGLLARWLKSES